MSSSRISTGRRTPGGAASKARRACTASAAASVILALGLLLVGCASPPTRPAEGRRFVFGRDTFGYANELKWEYFYDEQGNWSTRTRVPKPDYTLHCFVVARSAAQFFANARFDPLQPVANEARYRKLIHQVVHSSLRSLLPEEQRIVIPGYANLRDFSVANEALLKAECGGAWQSYFQRGHWRMIFPFSRKNQENMARQLLEEIQTRGAAVVHVACFPKLTINHALVVFGAQERAEEIEFEVYDPNEPEAPTKLTYCRITRSFDFPPNRYFLGGRVNVYQVYHRWNY